MKSIFIKPELDEYFDNMPLIGLWLKYDYAKAETLEELTNLCHKWAELADTTTNSIKKTWFEIAYKGLFSIITKKSFDSKIFIK